MKTSRRSVVLLVAASALARGRAATASYYAHDPGLAVVKRHEQPREEEEYVTSFYTRARAKRRALFGRQLQQHEERERRGMRKDHALDHYFDHHLLGASRTEARPSPAPSTSSNAARCVRGGGVAAPRTTRPSSSSMSARNDASASPNEDKISSETISPNHYQEQRHHHPRARPRSDSHRQSQYEDYDYDSYDDDRDADEQGEENSNHHLGLLRVPCNIAINSDEASMGHYTQSDYPSQTNTPVAAYVDTGAQVTIISAAAAKRAGIYHLMDRRYAGRATGVGHCRVLGRIPARHVYFLLGEEERRSRAPRDDVEHCREDGGYGGGYRGGGACGFDDAAGERDGGAVRMEGPALTVLEGTVTQGVDILFGLDVLEDWEASICMGPTKSLTIKKRRKGQAGVTGRGRYGSRAHGSESVVIPFADARPPQVRREAGARHPPRSPSRAHASEAAHAYDDDLDDEDFSPTASDIESDLDLLDRSGHEFPEEGHHPHRAGHARTMQEMEDELRGEATRGPPARPAGRRREEEDHDYFRDEDEETEWEGQEELDLSGL